jgi:hypothetical protein
MSIDQFDGLDERSKKAFDFAQETTKQLISLATGVIALTITFSKDLAGGLSPGTKGYLAAAWFAYLFSVLCGVWTLMAMTGTLEPTGKSALPPSIRGSNVTIPSMLQIFSFALGVICTVVFGLKSLCPIWPFC